jgi:AcrR family transcriptional regulator
MMKSPKHARSASELCDRIVKAAGTMLVVDGFEHVSMRRVANEVGCSQMAMYRYFANKEALTYARSFTRNSSITCTRRWRRRVTRWRS